MTNEEWAGLTSVRKAKRTDGMPVDPGEFSYTTMCYLDVLQRRLGSPISLIRANHGPDGSAVDWCCLGVPFAWVVMEAIALPISVGIYSGLSIQTDSRPVNPYSRPARWLAVHEDEESKLGELRRLIYRRDDGWAYLVWSDHSAGSFEALQLIVQLAEAKRQKNMLPQGA